MEKFEKVINVLGWIAITIVILFIIGFVLTIITLVKYDECRQEGFEPEYCEKYKDY